MAIPMVTNYAAEPGGSILNAMNTVEDYRKKQLENDYYGPNIESEIGYKNALKNRSNTMLPADLQNQQNINKYYGQDKTSEIALRQAQARSQIASAAIEEYKRNHPGLMGGPEAQNIELAKIESGQKGNALSNGYPSPNMQSNNAMVSRMTLTPQAQAQFGQQNPLTSGMMSPQQQSTGQQNPFNTSQMYQQLAQAGISKEQQMANYYGQGGGRSGVDQRNLGAFAQQVAIDNQLPPERANEIAEAYMKGDKQLADGTELKPLSWMAQQKLNLIQRKNLPAALQTQLGNLDVLVQDLGNFDIDTVKKFAGPSGKAKLAYAKLKMATNPDDPNIDPDAREYLSQMGLAIQNMDQMRKAYGTSVVPDYVYKTVGRLTNPSDNIWNDPTQVEKNYKAVVNQTKQNRDLLQSKYLNGLGSSNPVASAQTSNATASSYNVKMTDPKGNKKLVHEEDVDAALKAGWKKR